MLALVLARHPKPLMIPALVREIDGAERAVADLVAIGLLERRGETVSVSAALAHLDALELP